MNYLPLDNKIIFQLFWTTFHFINNKQSHYSALIIPEIHATYPESFFVNMYFMYMHYVRKSFNKSDVDSFKFANDYFN